MKKIIAVVMVASPMFAFAQVPLSGVGDLADQFGSLVNTLIPILMGVAVLVFFWGLIKYIASASDEANKESGKTLMIWGMVALFVMVALWSILGFVQTQLGITGTVENSTPPTFEIPRAVP